MFCKIPSTATGVLISEKISVLNGILRYFPFSAYSFACSKVKFIIFFFLSVGFCLGYTKRPDKVCIDLVGAEVPRCHPIFAIKNRLIKYETSGKRYSLSCKSKYAAYA